MRAGLFTHTHTEDVLETETTTNTTQRVIPDGLPDYGVTVVGSSGTVLARRQLVALNAPGDVGTPGNPIVVMVNRDVPVVIG